MPREICAILPPREDDLLRRILGTDQGNYSPGCILPPGHYNSPHVFQTPDGKYFAWEDDYTCDCCPDPSDFEHCYTYREISEEEFRQMERKAAAS